MQNWQKSRESAEKLHNSIQSAVLSILQTALTSPNALQTQVLNAAISNLSKLKLIFYTLIRSLGLNQQERKSLREEQQPVYEFCVRLVQEPNLQQVDKLVGIVQTVLAEIDLAQPLSVAWHSQKLNTISMVAQHMIVYPSHQLFNQTPETRVHSWAEVLSLATPQAVQHQIESLHQLFGVGLSAFAKSRTSDNVLAQTFLLSSAIPYLIRKEKKNRRIWQFISKATAQQMREFLNFMEKGFTGKMLKLMLPSLGTCDKIQVEIKADTLNLDFINKLIDLETWNTLQKVDLPRGTLPLKVKVRVLSKRKLKKKNEPKVGNVILHIHGGGFIALTPKQHMTYTAQWAKRTQSIIFSVDYRKAPEHPYPAALNDCLQVYQWILTQGPRIYNYQPRRIILAGDSAGGNLVLALSLLLAKLDFRRPDFIFSFYPACKIDLNYFTPSFLISLDDPILSHNFLKLCIKSYLTPEARNLLDFCISPLVASKPLLQKLPPVHFLLGTRDPLFDDGCRMALRVRQINGSTRLTIFEQICHGFLNFDLLGKSLKKAVQKSTEFLVQQCSKQ